MKLLFARASTVVSIALFPFLANADSGSSTDKSGYTLFCPTPRSEMREWRTDVWGVSPFTIDAGHFEFELQAVSFTPGMAELEFPGFQITDPYPYNIWTYGSFVLKAGLLNNLDFEVGYVPYQTWTHRPGGRTYSGGGITTAGLKWNLWGNDGGKTALSISGTAIFPTTTHDFDVPSSIRNRLFAGGPRLEFQAELPWDFMVRVNSGAVIYESQGLDSPPWNAARGRINANIENRLSIGRQIIGGLSAFAGYHAEVFTDTPSADNPLFQGVDLWAGYADVTLTYRIFENVEIYAGSSFGVNGRYVPDYAPFAGINARF